MFLRTAEFNSRKGTPPTRPIPKPSKKSAMKMLDVSRRTSPMTGDGGDARHQGENHPAGGSPAVSTIFDRSHDAGSQAPCRPDTSHFLGQNFSRAQEIKFQDQAGGESCTAWTTSWGVSTRLVGALLMTHSDDDGLVLPPRMAPKHVVILPIYRGDDDRAKVRQYCDQLGEGSRAAHDYADGKSSRSRID